MSETVCIHCGRRITRNVNPITTAVWYTHTHDNLNRCQSVDVPYGHNAHPWEGCPNYCSGFRELGPCTHIAQIDTKTKNVVD